MAKGVRWRDFPHVDLRETTAGRGVPQREQGGGCEFSKDAATLFP